VWPVRPNMNAMLTKPVVCRLSLLRLTCLCDSFLGEDNYSFFIFLLTGTLKSIPVAHLNPTQLLSGFFLAQKLVQNDKKRELLVQNDQTKQLNQSTNKQINIKGADMAVIGTAFEEGKFL